MARSNPDPKLIASVLELVRTGSSAAQVEETLGVPRSTATRWTRAVVATCATAQAKTDEIAAAVAVLGDDWSFVDAAELAGVSSDTVRAWLRARIDHLLHARGLSPDAVQSLLQFSAPA